MENIAELVKARRSVRTFDKREVSKEDIKKLSDFFERTENPYNIPVRFRLLDAKNKELKCPVVSGASLYVGAKVSRVPHAEESVGYSFEMLVLYAQSIGIGTVLIGGTMDRSAFERAMELSDNEMMPCISPLGYTAEKMSVRESMMRKAVKANQREPFEALFFDGSFDASLTKEKAGVLLAPLEAVRLAPSAVNKQPWRVVFDKNSLHFYLKHSKGFISENVGDMQKIDMGIALCHFALTAREAGIDVRFSANDPGIAAKSDMEYIMTAEY
ncbi:MAG: nitroreductase [Oscillospiraceae bacterium]|nr:nitroreductase [Oscillospiraceae bacterium]